MADSKISALPSDTAPASADLVPFVDVTAGRTEQVTVANLALAAAGLAYVTTNAQSGTTYTALQTDHNKLITVNNGSAHTMTLPALTAGTVITVYCIGAGGITFSASGTTFVGSSPSVGCAQNEGMQAIYTSGTTIAVIGGTA